MYNFSSLHQKIDKAIQHITKELSGLRTGKASPQLLDLVFVDAYGSKMRINELANITAPDPNMILVSPWDKSLLEAISKGIASASLNLNPVVDGDMIRIVVPSLTQERREEMVKILKQKVEAGHAMLRGIRVDVKKEIESLKDEKGVSEDDINADIDELDKIMKTGAVQLEELAKKKETDLMTV